MSKLYGCNFLDSGANPINFIFNSLTEYAWIDIQNDATLQFLDKKWIITQNQVILYTTDDFFGSWNCTNGIPGKQEGEVVDGIISQFEC